MSLEIVKEALDNNWHDRIFLHYQQLIDPKAVRPQDYKSEEWLNIVKTLKLKVDAFSVKQPAKPSKNDSSTSSAS
jgi:hypothetical protein